MAGSGHRQPGSEPGAATAHRRQGSVPLLTRRRHLCCPYPGCTRRFINAVQRDNHLRIQSHHRPWICPVAGCTRGFRRRCDLYRHQRAHAPAVRQGRRRKHPETVAPGHSRRPQPLYPHWQMPGSTAEDGNARAVGTFLHWILPGHSGRARPRIPAADQQSAIPPPQLTGQQSTAMGSELEPAALLALLLQAPGGSQPASAPPPPPDQDDGTFWRSFLAWPAPETETQTRPAVHNRPEAPPEPALPPPGDAPDRPG